MIVAPVMDRDGLCNADRGGVTQPQRVMR